MATTDLMESPEVPHIHIKLPMEEMDLMDQMVTVMVIMKKRVGVVAKEVMEIMDIKELQEAMDKMEIRQETVTLLPINLRVIIIVE